MVKNVGIIYQCGHAGEDVTQMKYPIGSFPTRRAIILCGELQFIWIYQGGLFNEFFKLKVKLKSLKKIVWE